MIRRNKARFRGEGRSATLARLSILFALWAHPAGAVCSSNQAPEAPVLERLPLIDGSANRAIDAWTRGATGASASFALVPDERPAKASAPALRITYGFAAQREAQAGVRVNLAGLDARRYDHLEFWVRGDPRQGYARSFEVGFLKPRPGRPDMMESGSYVVSDVSDRWQYVRVPLNLMSGIRTWTGLQELVVTFESARAASDHGASYLGDVALIRTGSAGPSASDPVPTPKKDRWQQAFGGKEAARPHVAARMAGWPNALLVAPPSAEVDDRAFLMRLARDTWRGLAELTDGEHGLPIDRVGFPQGSVAPAQSQVGDYTGPSTIGLYLMSIVAAEDLGLIDEAEAVAKLERTFSTLEKLERFNGFFYNYYDTTSLERTTNFISSLDSAWLTAGLMVVRAALPELSERSSRLIEETDYGWLYDPVKGLLSHGYYVNLQCPSEYHYGLLYTEARILSLIAIGKGDVPEAHWSRLMRTFPARETWQSQQPRGGEPASGYYEHAGYHYVPSWGGSMFEALMPTLVIDENATAPDSLGPNDRIHAILQRRHALDELGYPVWGMSPSATVNSDGYGEFGVSYLGTLGYPGGVVTPHASALALAVTPQDAIANLRKLASLYDLYGPYGFYDAVDPTSGKVSHRYLTLDQEMLFLALANYLEDHVVQRTFASDPIAARALPILAKERFFDHDESAAQLIK